MSFRDIVHGRSLSNRRPSAQEVAEARARARQPEVSIVGAGRFSAGRWTYWHDTARFCAYKPGDVITLGSFTSVSQDVRILAGGNHNLRDTAQYPFTLMSEGLEIPAEPQPFESISVGSDVWIGTGAIIVGSVVVADGAVIGAGAVVTKSVLPYTIVGGVPARVIGTRFEASDVQKLLALRWWEWPDDVVRDAEPMLRSSDLVALWGFAEAGGLLKGNE